MNEITKTILITGALLAMLGVILGAFGAHALKKSLSTEMLTVYSTAVEYHFIHALGLILIGLIHYHFPDSAWVIASAILLFAGILLFSGSLYALSISGVSRLGMITPIGGLCFITGWVALAIGIYKVQA